MNSPQHTIFLGKDMLDYVNALFADDKHKMKELSAKFEKKLKEELQLDYTNLKKHLIPQHFEIFKQIDKSYERQPSSTTITNYGDKYFYRWYVKGVHIPYKDYGNFNLEITYQSKYSLSIYFCDDSGYEQGTHTISTDISPELIISTINQYAKSNQIPNP